MPDATCGRWHAILVQLSDNTIKRDTIGILFSSFSQHISLFLDQLDMVVHQFIIYLGKYPTPTIGNSANWRHIALFGFVDAASIGAVHDLLALHLSHQS